MLNKLAESCISIYKIVDSTNEDGEGTRISIYAAGCSHKCAGCNIPQSWSIDNGVWMSVNDLFEYIKGTDLDVTFTGGDPLFQAEAFYELACRIKKETNKTIWCYTGFTAEQLSELQVPLLRYIDVLVEGPFIQSKKNSKLKFRGSSNQRILIRKGNYYELGDF